MRCKYLLTPLLGLLIAALLIGCGSETPSTDTTDAATTEAVTTAPEPASIDLVKDGKTAFTIIRAEDNDSEAIINQMKKIMDAFEKSTGVRIGLGTDWVKVGQEPNAETYEILVGATNHPESAEALKGLKYRDCAVKLIGNKIVINGYTSDTIMKAVNYFINDILSRAEVGKDFSFSEADNYVSEAKYSLNSVTLGNAELDTYTILHTNIDSQYFSFVFFVL